MLPEIWPRLAELFPKVLGAGIVLLVGWIAGRALGKGVSKLLERAAVDEALRKTVLGKVLERSKLPPTKFFDLLARWFVYLIAILAAADALEVEALSSFIRTIVQYIPNLIAGVLVLIFGFIFSDFVGDLIRSMGKESGVEYLGPLSGGVKLLLYFIVIVVALTVMKIDVSIVYVFANALAWGMAVGISVGLGIAFGFGFKDFIAKNAERWFRSASEAAKRSEEFWDWYARRKD